MSKINSTIPIKLITSQIEEAENVLKYTLRLDSAFKKALASPTQIDPEPAAMSNLIDKYLDIIIEDCESFLVFSDCNFFGQKDIYEDNKDLSVLCKHSDFWRHAIKQDVVLFAFNTLRQVIGEGIILSPSALARLSNYTLKTIDDTVPRKICHHGFDYLNTTILNEIQNTKDEQPLLVISASEYSTESSMRFSLSDENQKKLENLISSTSLNSIAPNFKRQIQTIYNTIHENSGLSLVPLFLCPEDISKASIPVTLSTFEFFDFIVSRRKPSRNILPIINAFSEDATFSSATYKHYISSVNQLLVSIDAKEIDKKYVGCSSDSSDKLTLSDRIYLRWQIEKIFAPSTISCLYQNIIATKDKDYSLCDPEAIKVLASCLQLPNVFTRQYMLQMAVDILSKHYDEITNNDFFSDKRNYSPSTPMTQVHSYDSLLVYEKLSVWKTRYRRFITYFSQMVFPIYENYFFCLLWEMIKTNNPKSPDSENILEMYNLLRRYLNNPKTVQDLFSTDNIIINSKPKLVHFNSDLIIHPILTYDIRTPIDVRVYKECLTAHNTTFKGKQIPHFISLDYLNNLYSYLDNSCTNCSIRNYVQDLYILKWLEGRE